MFGLGRLARFFFMVLKTILGQRAQDITCSSASPIGWRKPVPKGILGSNGGAIVKTHVIEAEFFQDTSSTSSKQHVTRVTKASHHLLHMFQHTSKKVFSEND